MRQIPQLLATRSPRTVNARVASARHKHAVSLFKHVLVITHKHVIHTALITAFTACPQVHVWRTALVKKRNYGLVRGVIEASDNKDFCQNTACICTETTGLSRGRDVFVKYVESRVETGVDSRDVSRHDAAVIGLLAGGDAGPGCWLVDAVLGCWPNAPHPPDSNSSSPSISFVQLTSSPLKQTHPKLVMLVCSTQMPHESRSLSTCG